MDRRAVGVKGVKPLDFVEQDDRGFAVVQAVLVQNRSDGVGPGGAVDVAQFDFREPFLEIENFDQTTDEIGFADSGHAPEVDDDGAGEDFGNQVPNLDVVQQAINDLIDANEVGFQFGARAFKGGFSGFDRLKVYVHTEPRVMVNLTEYEIYGNGGLRFWG